MRDIQSLAIIITDPQQTISTWKKRFSAALGVIGGTSVLQRLLLQLARAGVQATIVLVRRTMGDIASDFGDGLNGMELCLRALPSPYAGCLVDAATTKEITHVGGEVLVFTDNVVADFELIERLLRSPDRNVAVVSNSHGRRSLRVLADDALRLRAILPGHPLGQKNASTDSSLIGVYKFDSGLVRAIARNRRYRSHDDLEFYEAALSIQSHQIHVMHAEPHRAMTVNDAIDLATANFVFLDPVT